MLDPNLIDGFLDEEKSLQSPSKKLSQPLKKNSSINNLKNVSMSSGNLARTRRMNARNRKQGIKNIGKSTVINRRAQKKNRPTSSKLTKKAATDKLDEELINEAEKYKGEAIEKYKYIENEKKKNNKYIISKEISQSLIGASHAAKMINKTFNNSVKEIKSIETVINEYTLDEADSMSLSQSIYNIRQYHEKLKGLYIHCINSIVDITEKSKLLK